LIFQLLHLRKALPIFPFFLNYIIRKYVYFKISVIEQLTCNYLELFKVFVINHHEFELNHLFSSFAILTNPYSHKEEDKGGASGGKRPVKGKRHINKT